MSTIAWIGCSVLLMGFVELAAGRMLSRTARGKGLRPALFDRTRLHLYEFVVAGAIGLLGLGGTIYHWVRIGDFLWGRSLVGDVTFFLIEGYLVYHGLRMLSWKNPPRLLILHHGLLIVPYAYLWHLGALYPYALLMAVTLLSSLIRDFQWYRRNFAGLDPRHRKACDCVISLLDALPPLAMLLHFFLIGIHQGALPVSLWVLAILPSILFAGVALYFALEALKGTIGPRLQTLSLPQRRFQAL